MMGDLVKNFELYAFTVEQALVEELADVEVGILVDWENRGKTNRQSGFDTEINQHTEQDLVNVRNWTSQSVVCRVDRLQGVEQLRQLDICMDVGADEVLLPMVRTVEEVETVLEHVQRKSNMSVGILVETNDAIAILPDLNKLPLSRVFLGLNDLAIDSGYANIFMPLHTRAIDGMLEKIDKKVGFGGLTLPERGNPLPCRLLMASMIHLGCDFSFLRRSFMADTKCGERAEAVIQIRQAMSKLYELHPSEVEQLHNELVKLSRT